MTDLVVKDVSDSPSAKSRKARVTAENQQEAQQLRAIWAERASMSQAEFGEQFDIGNQSAVGQFLNGITPLSLKAAAGFATGLRCKIVDFSPRLADQAETYSALSGLESRLTDLTQLTKEELQHVLLLRKLNAANKALLTNHAMSLARLQDSEGRASR